MRFSPPDEIPGIQPEQEISSLIQDITERLMREFPQANLYMIERFIASKLFRERVLIDRHLAHFPGFIEQKQAIIWALEAMLSHETDMIYRQFCKFAEMQREPYERWLQQLEFLSHN